MAKQTLTVQLMHANARIAELEAQLAESSAPCALPQGYDSRPFGYTGQLYVESQMRRIAGLPLGSAPKVIAPRTLPAHFVAAREAAIRLGKVVRVEASV